MTEQPFPTKTRLAFADDIAAGRVRWYNFVEPDAYNTVTGRRCIAALVEFVAAGLAEVPQCDEGSSSVAVLTPDGMAWVTRARTREPVSEAAMDAALVAVFNDLAENGPVSTSPETGPATGGVIDSSKAFIVGERSPDCVLPPRAESTKDGT